MATTPNAVQTINACLEPADAKALISKHAVKISLGSNSGLSLRIDFPERKLPDGTTVNRVRITPREDGTVDVRLTQILEHDLIGGVEPAAVKSLLATVLGMEI